MSPTENTYHKLIKDAEWRIGSFIAAGGKVENDYVELQKKRIREWYDAIQGLKR